MRWRRKWCAINDPYTAITCLDYLEKGLSLFARQGEARSRYHGPDGRLRLVLEPVTMDEVVAAAFDQLRHASRDSAPVLRHMLDVIGAIGRETALGQDVQHFAADIAGRAGDCDLETHD